jgi:Flp pilus assembly pilin Flp
MALRAFVALLRDETAQGLVEYALIIGLVSIAAVAALRFFGAAATNSLNNSANKMPNE